jgi:hypothetical protein
MFIAMYWLKGVFLQPDPGERSNLRSANSHLKGFLPLDLINMGIAVFLCFSVSWRKPEAGMPELTEASLGAFGSSFCRDMNRPNNSLP